MNAWREGSYEDQYNDLKEEHKHAVHPASKGSILFTCTLFTRSGREMLGGTPSKEQSSKNSLLLLSHDAAAGASAQEPCHRETWTHQMALNMRLRLAQWSMDSVKAFSTACRSDAVTSFVLLFRGPSRALVSSHCKHK